MYTGLEGHGQGAWKEWKQFQLRLCFQIPVPPSKVKEECGGDLASHRVTRLEEERPELLGNLRFGAVENGFENKKIIVSAVTFSKTLSGSRIIV